MPGIDMFTKTGSAFDMWKMAHDHYVWPDRFLKLSERHSWPIVNQLFTRERVKFLPSGPQAIQDIMITDSGTARMSKPNAPRTYDVGNVMAQIAVPWRHMDDYFVTNFHEVNTNRDPDKLVDLLKSRRTGMVFSSANKLEKLGMKCPASATDTDNPYGLPYWITPITPAQVTAQNTDKTVNHRRGMNPVYLDGNTAASCAGLDTTLEKYRLYRNWNDVWTNPDSDLTEDDIDKILGILMDMVFESPVTAKDIERGAFDNFQIYTTKAWMLAVQKKARMNNDNFGADFGVFAGKTRIKGNPVMRADELDAGTTNRMIFTNLDFFNFVVMEGDFFRETGPDSDIEQPDTFVTMSDLTFNSMCVDRGRQGVISYVAAG